MSSGEAHVRADSLHPLGSAEATEEAPVTEEDLSEVGRALRALAGLALLVAGYALLVVAAFRVSTTLGIAALGATLIILAAALLTTNAEG